MNQEPKYLMAVVSLFGIEDTNALSKKVKEAVAYAQTFNKAEKSGKGHIAKGVNIAKQLSEKADRRYRHITSIIKRNPNAVSRVHKESINEIKEIIVSRKAKRDK